MHHIHMPTDTCHVAHMLMMSWCKHTQIHAYIQMRRHTSVLQISQRDFREFREWRVIWLKRTKLQEMRIIDPPL